MRDLSGLAKDSMWVTSQEGGGLIHDNSPAMTAPGSVPATPQPQVDVQTNPDVTNSASQKVGTPSPRRVRDSSYSPSSPAWKTVSDG